MAYTTIEIFGPKEKFLDLPDDNEWLHRNEANGFSEDDGKGNWSWVLYVDMKDQLTKESLAMIKKHGLSVTNLSKAKSLDYSSR